MSVLRTLSVGLLVLLVLVRFDSFFASSRSLGQQNEILFQQIQREHGLSDQQMDEIRKIREITQRFAGLQILRKAEE